MAQLPPEEATILDILIRGKEARERMPIAHRTIVSRFEKYAFPVGLDDAGDPFPIPPRRDLEEDPDAG